MKIIRVFPRRTSFTPTDDLAFVGPPPLDHPQADEVHVSCAFTWDKVDHQERQGNRIIQIVGAETLVKAWGQYYPVKVGGPAYDDPGDGFAPGKYVKQGVVFTSRGCNNRCPWCLVSKREGRLRLLPIPEGNILQDNNFTQCPRDHQDKVFDMLSGQHGVRLSGGLETSKITPYFVERLRSLRIKELFLACDTKEAIVSLRKAVDLIGLKRDKVYCYALLKFKPSETISEATERMIEIWEAGAMPFAQLYQPPDKWIEYPLEWKRFQRTWSRPPAMKAFMKLQKE